MAKIVVVGAGTAGLATAARLAARGHQVTVCEAADRAGGALGVWRHEGMAFDTGPHTLTLPAVYRDLFIKTGARRKNSADRLEDKVDLRPLDPVRRFVFPDGTRLDLPNVSRGGVKSAFDAALGPGAGEQWLRAVDHGNRAWDAVRPVLVERPNAAGRDLTRLLRSRAGRTALTPGRSLRSLARRWFTERRLSLVLDDYARQAGADPTRAPGVLAARIYVEHVFGAWQVWGGLYQLADALYDRALGLGIDVRLNTSVARIETAGDAVHAVTLADGERIQANVVIAGVDKARLAKLLGLAADPAHGTYPPPITTLCLALSAAPDAEAMPHETVLLDDERAAIRVHVPADRPRAWTVHAEGSWDAGKLLAALAARGLDVRARIVAQHLITRADGSAYGPAPRNLKTALLRSPIAQPTRGLFHVGASARPGSGLSFATQSALLAAELVGDA